MRQIRFWFGPPPFTTEDAWRLAASLEREWLARGTSDAQRAARNVFEAWCTSAQRLLDDGFVDRLPRELRRNA